MNVINYETKGRKNLRSNKKWKKIQNAIYQIVKFCHNLLHFEKKGEKKRKINNLYKDKRMSQQKNLSKKYLIQNLYQNARLQK